MGDLGRGGSLLGPSWDAEIAAPPSSSSWQVPQDVSPNWLSDLRSAVPSSSPTPQKTVVERRVVGGIWHDYDEWVADGYQPGVFERVAVGFGKMLLPPSDPREVITYSDGSRYTGITAGPSSGALGGQATAILVPQRVVATAHSVRAGAVGLSRHYTEELIESVATEYTGVPVVIPGGRGAARPVVVEQGRDALGRFLPRNPGQVRPGSTAESSVWSSIDAKPNWSITPGRVHVRDTTGQLRVYDGMATSPSGHNIGLEVKSGTGRLTPEQRAFDLRLNSSRHSNAMGVGRHIGIQIDRALEIRR